MLKLLRDFLKVKKNKSTDSTKTAQTKRLILRFNYKYR